MEDIHLRAPWSRGIPGCLLSVNGSFSGLYFLHMSQLTVKCLSAIHPVCSPTLVTIRQVWPWYTQEFYNFAWIKISPRLPLTWCLYEPPYLSSFLCGWAEVGDAGRWSWDRKTEHNSELWRPEWYHHWVLRDQAGWWWRCDMMQVMVLSRSKCVDQTACTAVQTVSSPETKQWNIRRLSDIEG